MVRFKINKTQLIVIIIIITSSSGLVHTIIIYFYRFHSDHSISTRVERLDEAIMEASRSLGEPSGLWQYSETSCWVRETRHNYILLYRHLVMSLPGKDFHVIHTRQISKTQVTIVIHTYICIICICLTQKKNVYSLHKQVVMF